MEFQGINCGEVGRAYDKEFDGYYAWPNSAQTILGCQRFGPVSRHTGKDVDAIVGARIGSAFRWQSLGRLTKVDRYLRHLGPRRFHRLWRLLDPRHIRSAPSTTLNTLQEIHCAPIWIATPPLLREESDFEEQSSHPRSRVWRYRPACRLTNASGCSSRSSTRYKWRSAGMLLGEDLADRALRHGKPNMGSGRVGPGVSVQGVSRQ